MNTSLTPITQDQQLPDNLIISPSATEGSFTGRIATMLQKIRSNPIGKRLIDKIGSFSEKVIICFGQKDDTTSTLNPLFYSFSKITVTVSMKEDECYTASGDIIPNPDYVVLVHELIHAYHFLSGKYSEDRSSDPIIWGSDEEYKTIMGFPSKKGGRLKDKITENSFRKAEGLPERFSHLSPSPRTPLTDLEVQRIKFLGQIHLNNCSKLSSPYDPGPMTLPTFEDFGENSHVGFFFRVIGVNTDFSPSKNTGTSLFWTERSNRLSSEFKNSCYFYPYPDLNSSGAKECVTSFFPLLKKTDFTIKDLVVVRISQSEFAALMGCAL